MSPCALGLALAALVTPAHAREDAMGVPPGRLRPPVVEPSLRIDPLPAAPEVDPLPGTAIWKSTTVATVDAPAGQRWALSAHLEAAGDPAALRFWAAAEGGTHATATMRPSSATALGPTPTPITEGVGPLHGLLIFLQADADAPLSPGPFTATIHYTLESR